MLHCALKIDIFYDIILKRGNIDWLIKNDMVSLNNTVKIHNALQKLKMYVHYILLQIPVKGVKGLVIAAVTLTGRSYPYLILSKHLG